MIDFSHGNSSKDYQKQVDVGRDVARQVGDGDTRIFGIMMESHLQPGRQDLKPGTPLQYGVSITDGCIAWEESAQLMTDLAVSVTRRRVHAEAEEIAAPA